MRLILDFFKNIYNHRGYLIILIFFVSILCSLFFLSFFSKIGPSQHQIPGSDYFAYYQPMANSLLQGEGFTIEGKVYPNIAPGFSVILSGIFTLSKLTGIEELDLIVVFNIIFTALASCLLFFVAQELFNRKIALISAFLWMSYPFNLWLIKNPNTEVFFIPLLYFGLLFYILALKKKNIKFIFFVGLILGLASLIRLISLFLPFFLAILIFFFLKEDSRRMRIFFAIILLIGNLLAFLPWGLYTLSQTGSFIPISTLGTKSIVYGLTISIVVESGEGDRVTISEDIAALIERIKKAENLDNINSFIFLTKEFRADPLTFFKLIGLKIARVWYATSENWWEGKILAAQIFYLISALAGILYGIKTKKYKIRDINFLLAMIFYFWIMTVLAVSILRYMIPIMGLVIIFSAIMVNIVIDRLVKKFKLYPSCQF